jgi:hypothetical protein
MDHWFCRILARVQKKPKNKKQPHVSTARLLERINTTG